MNALQHWQIRHGISNQAVAELAQLFAPDYFPSNQNTEQAIQDSLRLQAANHGNSLWRNNQGAMSDATGRLVRYGLGHVSKNLNLVWKSSDLIGITPVVWEGRRFGVFTAVEVKQHGWRGPKDDHEKAQSNFLQTVESLGGIGTFAQSVDDYLAKVTHP